MGGEPVVTQPGGEGGSFPMGSAASLALGETCTEKNDARSDRALLVPMRSQEASAVCVRDHESRLAPRPQDQTAVVGILVFKL
jgi:hypothetical protein